MSRGSLLGRLSAGIVALAASIPAFAQVPPEILAEERNLVELGRESGFLPAAAYAKLLARMDAPPDLPAARALFRDLVQFHYDHESGDDYLSGLARRLQREDMRAIGWEALPDEIRVERYEFADGRVVLGTGGPLSARHPELDPKALLGQRLLVPGIGTGVGLPQWWIAQTEWKAQGKAAWRRPRAILLKVRSEAVDDAGRLLIAGEWIRPGKGVVEETIALELADLGNGGTIWKNEAEGLMAARPTCLYPGLRRGATIPGEWIRELGWDRPPPVPREEPAEWEAAEAVRRAPGVEFPLPCRPGPEGRAAARRLVDGGRIDLQGGDPEDTLLRLRFALIYGDDLPKLAVETPKAFRALEDAVREFLRGGPAAAVLKLKPDAEALMAAVKRAPSFDPPPPTGEIRPGLFARFPEGYSCWRRWPLLVVLHGQYREPAYDFGIWGPLADAAGMILICPIYGTTGGTTRSPQADAAVLDEVAAMILRHNVDPDRVYLSGISMGGAMTWRLGQAYPDRWAALGPEIHGPKAFADGYPFLGNVADVPLFVMEGEFDGLNTVYNRRAAKELRAAGGPFEYHELRNFGHDRMTWLYPMFLEFAAARRRDPHPRRIDHAAMNAYEGTRAWLSIRSVSGGAAFGARDGAFNPRKATRYLRLSFTACA